MYPRTRRINRRPVAWRSWIAWILLLGALAVGIVALFLPLAPPPVPLPPFNGTCDSPLNQSCIPDMLELETLKVSHCTNLTGDTKLFGDVICQNPIWPSCLDISGQGCMTPLQESCLPSSVTNWNVNNTLMSENTVLKGSTTCNNPVDIGCIPPIPSTGVTCDVPLNSSCVDISGEECTTPINENCIPDDLTFDNLFVNNLTAVNFTHINMVEMNETSIFVEYLNVNKSLTCGMPGIIAEDCLPPTPTSKLVCDVKLNETCLDISGHGVCSSPISQSCIDISGESCFLPVDLSCVPNIPTSKLECDAVINSTCVDISGESCTTPINQNCVDISGETCTSPIDPNCIPDNLNLNNLFVNNFTAVNFTFIDMTVKNATTIVAENVFTTNLNFNESLTCTPPATIDEQCIPPTPTSKLVCDAKLNETCLDISGHGACSSPISQSCIDISGESCTTPINQNCIDISGETCTIPINANCVDISGETCTAPVDASCIPEKDVQAVALTDFQSTTDLIFTDMPGMTLTTSNSGTGRYLIFANMQMSQTTSSAQIFVILNLNGVDVPDTQRIIQLESGNLNIQSIQEFAPSLSNGDTVKIRWKKGGPGSISVSNRRLIIQEV